MTGLKSKRPEPVSPPTSAELLARHEDAVAWANRDVVEYHIEAAIIEHTPMRVVSADVLIRGVASGVVKLIRTRDGTLRRDPNYGPLWAAPALREALAATGISIARIEQAVNDDFARICEQGLLQRYDAGRRT